MQYSSPVAFRTSLEARLLNQSREAGLELGRLRRRVVFERLLARLARSDEASWVLKGGMALEIRIGDRARATRDLDLALRHVSRGGDDGEWVRGVLVEALIADPDNDWFEFRVLDDRPIMPQEVGQGGWRFRIHAHLAGRTFERVRVDVVAGFDEAISTERFRLPGVLSFAGIEAVAFDVLDRREHFAEKLHALTRPRVRPNTRVKDLADLILLIDLGLGADADLLGVIGRVFASAGTHEVPVEIEDPPDFWRESYGQLASELQLSVPTLDEAGSMMKTFYSQLLGSLAQPIVVSRP